MSQTKVQLINNVSGDSGFGVSSPNGVLSIKDATDTYFYLQNDSTGTGSGDGSRLGFTGASSILRIQNQEDSDIAFHSNGTEHMRIKSDGKVGIGDPNPDALLHVGAGTNADGTDVDIIIGGTSINTRQTRIRKKIQSSDRALEIYAATGSSDEDIRFFSDGSTERMRIDSSGKVGIGITSLVAKFSVSENANLLEPMRIDDTNNTDGNRHRISFRTGNSEVGKIVADRSSTTYITSSDYRLKENETIISNGITRLKSLKPYRFNFKIKPEKIVDGFFAHEVGTVVPEAITGTKDEVDSDNNPVYQGIDQSKLVPLLTAALQEEITKREALEARVATLEAA